MIGKVRKQTTSLLQVFGCIMILTTALNGQNTERDTIYYYEPEKLVDSYLGHVLSLTDYAVYFEIDTAWTHYDLVEVHLLFTSDTQFSRILPITDKLYVQASHPDTTPIDPLGRKSDLGLIPGAIIDTVTFTLEDTTDLFPNWVIVDVGGCARFKGLSGNFWLRGYLMVYTAFDTIPPFSDHMYYQDTGIWWVPSKVDHAVRIVVEKTTLGHGNKDNTQDDFYLYQNYPNPFNPSTTITYDLPDDAYVNLIIYDILGREVITLIDWIVPAGYHQVVWNGKDKSGRDVPTGIYIARFATPQHTKSIKMVLMK